MMSGFARRLRPVRACRRILQGAQAGHGFPRYAAHQEMYSAAFWIVRFYYIVNLFLVYRQLATIRSLGLSDSPLDPLWPVVWIEWLGLEPGSLLILHVSTFAGFLGVFCWHLRWVRVVVVLAQLLVAAFANSFGAVNHGYHEWLWLGACFVFLPNGRKDEIGATRAGRMTFLTVFSMTQGLILLFYSLSGVYKVLAAAVALNLGKVGGFAPEAMALTLANRMSQTDSTAIWAPFIIENHWLGWPLYLVLYFIEFVALFVLLRPALHRLWGLMLVAFHFGTFFFMAITFETHVLIATMLFIFSPFAPARPDWRVMLRQIPMVGFLFAALPAKRRVGRPGGDKQMPAGAEAQ